MYEEIIEERFKIEERKWVQDIVDDTFPEQEGDFISENDYRNVLKSTARHFAEWQKEQKPMEWSEEDEGMLDSIIATCKLFAQEKDSGPAKHLFEMQENWLKSIRERFINDD